MAQQPIWSGGGGAIDISSAAGNIDNFASVTPGATANTKGSWRQLHSALPHACAGFYLSAGAGNFGNNNNMMLDIGIGGAGSEIVRVPNILFPLRSFASDAVGAFFAVQLPKGARVAARLQANGTSVDSAWVGIAGIPAHSRHPIGYQRVTDYGSNTGATSGVTVTSAYQWGSWAQIVSSTTNPIRLFYVCVAHATQTGGATALLQIGRGGAGSEQVILQGVLMAQRDTVRRPAILGPFGIGDIPAGTRLAARLNFGNSNADASVSILGLD
jgi:hypothetical protein